MSATCCPLYGGDGDEPSVYRDAIVVARKVHICCECDEIIEPRTKYESVIGLWDGRFGRFKTCLSCVSVRGHFDCGDGWAFEALWRQIGENVFPTMSAGGKCLEGMSPLAKSKMFDEYNKWLPRNIRQREWFNRAFELRAHTKGEL